MAGRMCGRNVVNGANTIWKSAATSTPQAVARVADLAGRSPEKAILDGDGKTDVLWRNVDTGADTIWKSGNASTSQAVTGVADQSWFFAGVGDFDGDGKSDVFWRNSDTGANTISKSADTSTRQVTAASSPIRSPVTRPSLARVISTAMAALISFGARV